MDAFYQETYAEIFMRWIYLNPKQDITMTYTTKPYEKIKLTSQHSIATVTLYPHCIIEEQAWDRKTHKVIFYIHFQMANLAHAKRLYEDLLEAIYENCSQPLAKILLVCSGGLTTSYFASKMQDLCDLEHLNYKFDAVGYNMVYSKAIGYDLILAAPQVSYMVPKMIEKLPNHIVKALPTKYFGRNDYQGALKYVLKILNHEQNEKKI
jgi:cellobiose-specific phosphotransferase system component IIB